MSDTSATDVALNWEQFYRNYRQADYIPGYEIVNKLGSGVFGAVFKARKTSIGKFYAIKFLKVDDEATKTAIVRELESLRHFAQIDHPNLVSIEDKGEVDGIPYIIMNYAGEETLRRRLEQGRLPEAEAVAIFVQICEGVAALHEKSIVHFDLKPSNVFIKAGVARVGDYGLSRLTSESHKTLSMGRGTPYYMAPEMLRKKGDRRSDIYSLGVILFECLAGEVPFKGDSEWEVLKKHETEPITFPETISPRFRAIISRCMAKDPEARYGSVRELVTDLSATGSAGSPSVSPTSATPKAMGPPFLVGLGLGRRSNSNSTVDSTRTSPATTPSPVSALNDMMRAIAGVLARLRAGIRAHYRHRPGSGEPIVVEPEGVVPDHGLVGNSFHVFGRFVEVVVLGSLLPLRYLPWILSKSLGFLLILPFKILAVGVKIFVVALMFGAIFFVLRVFFSVLLGVRPFG
ncbi:MAG: serine/threonine protein kinase [Planctomycetes bacterium]|nr:serine/threonine protein kinase [Planctomycetota bacterium]MBI3846875.1 serine/threonine protein kinase [Planctomycetota bacterium]